MHLNEIHFPLLRAETVRTHGKVTMCFCIKARLCVCTFVCVWICVFDGKQTDLGLCCINTCSVQWIKVLMTLHIKSQIICLLKWLMIVKCICVDSRQVLRGSNDLSGMSISEIDLEYFFHLPYFIWVQDSVSLLWHRFLCNRKKYCMDLLCRSSKNSILRENGVTFSVMIQCQFLHLNSSTCLSLHSWF